MCRGPATRQSVYDLDTVQTSATHLWCLPLAFLSGLFFSDCVPCFPPSDFNLFSLSLPRLVRRCELFEPWPSRARREDITCGPRSSQQKFTSAFRDKSHTDTHTHTHDGCVCEGICRKGQTKQTGCRRGTRPEFSLCRGHHESRGVSLSTRTVSVRTPLHASQKPRDTRCSSNIDAYQRFFPPSHAWFRTTTKASRSRTFTMSTVV